MKFLESLIKKVQKADALDAVAAAISKAADPALSPKSVRDFLSGTWLGHPLHPLMVTVPIGAWVSALLLDVMHGDERAAKRLTGFGVVTALPTAAAGLSDWRYTSGKEQRVGVAHALTNSVALGLYAASYAARAGGHTALGKKFSLVGAGALGVGGYLGGHLTYADGVGVDANAFQAGPEDWHDIAGVEEVGQGLVTRDYGGVSVLVTRTTDGEVVAIANRCSHRGGPLNEGERNGDCVSCPWHDSVFALATGEVKEGPATRPQDVFETRTVGSRIEIRHSEARSLQQSPV